MRLMCAMILAGALTLTASAGTIFEASGPVSDKTPGFRFGTLTFTDNDRVCAKFDAVEMSETANGRLTTEKLRLPHKQPGKGAYFKVSFDCKYRFVPGAPGGRPQRCNQGVFFYDKDGKVLPDCYDTLYPDPEGRHYERVLYAWDEVDTLEVFFQKPWAMNEKNGDRCTLEVANVKVEAATWEDAAAYADRVYGEVAARAPLAFAAEGDWTKLLPRTMEALKTGKPWRVVMLGDSIVQDTFHSQFHALVKREFPQSNFEWVLSMRGGTGCWHYCLAENFYPYVVDHKPDLLLIGGISNWAVHDEKNRKDVGPTGADAMLRVAKLARERLGCEVLVVNQALHCDRRPRPAAADPTAPLPKMPFSPAWLGTVMPRLEYDVLRQKCAEAKIQWWDALTPCYGWLFGSGLPFEWYSRDTVHSGEYGKQIIGRVMLGYLLTGK